ncbi:hypothetical protein A5765_17890 [Mycolicibacterium celeriflavum]|uniref:hypothetical protein n=1 Tax=Mycolicibacterium celeriflavum TaxID=1249101 RepID=UPI0007FCDD18|nr:hypothetical protein [Mycolicibacterium celeriflavum]OBG24252.1 hypothetical protein A5765_17890 [Mycolicibacterium celeriflavum]
MRTIRVAAAAAGVCGLLVASASGWAQQESAAEVIEKLQSEGYTVRIDKIGTAPLDECVVTSVRNPQQFTQLRPVLGGNQDGVLFPVVISQPISVSLDCSRH